MHLFLDKSHSSLIKMVILDRQINLYYRQLIQVYLFIGDRKLHFKMKCLLLKVYE